MDDYKLLLDLVQEKDRAELAENDFDLISTLHAISAVSLRLAHNLARLSEEERESYYSAVRAGRSGIPS